MTMLPPDFGGRDFNSWKKRAGNITGEPVRFPKHVLQMKEGSFCEQRRSAAMESGLIRGGSAVWTGGRRVCRFTAFPAQNAMLFAGIVTLVQLVFGGSGIVPAALVAILLNIILPKEKEA